MSSKSNNQGRAYEYICLKTIYEEISKTRPAAVEENSSFRAALKAWQLTEADMQVKLKMSAAAAVNTLFDLEPLILEEGRENIILKIQPDSEGRAGDVRDILIIRKDVQWEIGLSLKHNHFAVKHSRLAKALDFGEKWFGLPCSAEYWKDIKPIFDYLEREKQRGSKWSELPDKENDIYVPLLTAFKDEILRRYNDFPELPGKMVEYLLGEYDFYKVISVDSRRLTQIQPFNLRGGLNKPGKKLKPKITIPVSSLPSRIVDIEFKPGSKNTVELYMNNGWQFSFRIHNAESYVKTSLKFDIQIIGMPASVMTINCIWS